VTNPRRNPVLDFQVDRESIFFVGHDLQRPECILAERDGTLWSADARGGVMRIDPDGGQELVAQAPADGFARATDEARRFTEGTLPNGLAFAANGDFLVANFGTDRLEVMRRDGASRVLVDAIDGMPVGKVNFVLRDRKDRIWITVSTRVRNWMRAIGPNVADGYVALVDEHGVRVVADGFRFTNEIRFDADEEYLYVVETAGRRITRLRVTDDGSLSEREVFGPSDLGGLPDGIAFDAFGNLWGTLVMTDQLFVLTPEGDMRVVLDDGNPVASRALLDAFERDAVTPETMLAAGGTLAPWFASVTFGGPDLRTVYVGSLRGTRIPAFRAPVAGLRMVHW
jgi:gluconolactonase